MGKKKNKYGNCFLFVLYVVMTIIDCLRSKYNILDPRIFYWFLTKNRNLVLVQRLKGLETKPQAVAANTTLCINFYNLFLIVQVYEDILLY